MNNSVVSTPEQGQLGLGKTIEAVMVALELITRHRTRKILGVCPASLQMLWKEQMRSKFGLDFRIVNSNLMKELRRKRGTHVDSWNPFSRLITTIDFLKQERPLRLFRELLPGPDEPAFPRKFDLLIVDEAHNYHTTSEVAEILGNSQSMVPVWAKRRNILLSESRSTAAACFK